MSRNRNEIGKYINGTEAIDNGKDENKNGRERNITIFPFPIILYDRAKQPEILK